MKSKLIIFLILLVIFAGFMAVRFFIIDSQNAYGRLKIVSSPTTSIFVNSVVIGKSPFEDKYKVGEYVLKLIPEGVATETASWQSKIKIYKNALTYVNRELGTSDTTSAGEIFTTTKMDKSPKNAASGEVYVETEPQGAIVYLDNDEKSVAPVALSDVLKGEHELSVFMPGFLRRTQKINIDPGYRVNASFKLAVDQSQKQSVVEATSSAKISGSKDTKSEASGSATAKKTIVIKDTPTGWLRVREEPSISATEAAKVKPGEKYELLDEKEGWYKIEYEKGKTGWISSEYSRQE